MNTVKFHFIAPVWGEKFTGTFLQLSLPSQLSEGNIRSLNKSRGHKYKIFTTSEDAQIIKKSRAYAKLCGIIETEIHIIDDAVDKLNAGKKNKYDIMTICHGRGIMEAVKDQAAIISLSADLIFSDGSISNMYRIASSGKRVIAIGGYRMTLDTAGPLLLENYYSTQNNSISISSRELIKLSLDNIHPDSEILFWGSKNFLNIWPAYLYWHVPGEGVVQRGIHLSPIMINPAVREEILTAECGMGIDGYDYMMRAVPDFDNIHIVDDSDEMAIFSMQSLPLSCHPSYEPNVLDVAAWILKHCCDYHVRFLDTKLRFHYSDLSPEWEEVETESDRVVDSIRTTVDFFKKEAGAWKAFEALKAEYGKQDAKVNDLSNSVRALLCESANIANRLGEELYKSGLTKDAQEFLIHAMKRNPISETAYSNLAVLYWENAEKEKAIEHIMLAYRLAPQNQDVLRVYESICSGCGLINFKDGDTEGAMTWLRKALDTRSSTARSICRLGLMKWENGEKDDALKRFREALNSDCEDRIVLTIFYIASMKSDRMIDAEEYLSNYLMSHAGDLDMAYCLHSLLIGLGKVDEAKELLEKYSSFESKNEKVSDLISNN